MSKEKIPPTLESLQQIIDELQWDLEQLTSKVDDLERELKELKDDTTGDLKDDIKDIISRLEELENGS